jgi:hypothetical protein
MSRIFSYVKAWVCWVGEVSVGINSGSYESPNGETTDRAILPIYYLNIKIPRYENYLTRM